MDITQDFIISLDVTVRRLFREIGENPQCNRIDIGQARKECHFATWWIGSIWRPFCFFRKETGSPLKVLQQRDQFLHFRFGLEIFKKHSTSSLFSARFGLTWPVENLPFDLSDGLLWWIGVFPSCQFGRTFLESGRANVSVDFGVHLADAVVRFINED